MISLSPLVPCINEYNAFFTEILFVGLLENSLEPCLVRSRTGVLEHVGVVLPTRRIVPGRHDTSEADASRTCELKILQCDFPVIMHAALKVRIEQRRRVYRGNEPSGRELCRIIE